MYPYSRKAYTLSTVVYAYDYYIACIVLLILMIIEISEQVKQWKINRIHSQLEDVSFTPQIRSNVFMKSVYNFTDVDIIIL